MAIEKVHCGGQHSHVAWLHVCSADRRHKACGVVVLLRIGKRLPDKGHIVWVLQAKKEMECEAQRLVNIGLHILCLLTGMAYGKGGRPQCGFWVGPNHTCCGRPAPALAFLCMATQHGEDPVKRSTLLMLLPGASSPPWISSEPRPPPAVALLGQGCARRHLCYCANRVANRLHGDRSTLSCIALTMLECRQCTTPKTQRCTAAQRCTW